MNIGGINEKTEKKFKNWNVDSRFFDKCSIKRRIC